MEKVQGPKIMSLESIKQSTNNFSEELKLGTGQFGTVYKGVQNGEEIAVKKLLLKEGQDDQEQFKCEFEKLWKLHHPNIIQLLGYCYELKRELLDLNGRLVFADNVYRVLCFEYMHNGSLQKHLHDEFNGLDWKTRYKIIKGTCEGVRYLHKDLENPIYHLDIKPENILLDKNMVPKLADFGISKLVSNHNTRYTNSYIGTRGYLPPEYIERNMVSNKTDIYSLGVVMIRIMTGHDAYFKIVEMPSNESISLVHENWRKRLQATPGCTSVEGECQQVTRCIEIALSCINADRKQRPEIEEIIDWLNETEQVIEKLAMRHSAVSHLDKIFTVGSSPGISKLLDIYPTVVRFPFERNKQIQCAVTLTNKTDHYVVVWITPPSCPDTRPVHLSFPASSSRGEQSYFAETMEPHSSLAVPMTMKELWVLPQPDTCKLEVLMVVETQKEHLESLQEASNMDSGFLRKVEALREDKPVHRATLTTVICDAAWCETTAAVDGLKFIPGFRDAELTDVHPTETWFSARHKGGRVSIWNYQTQERLGLLRVTKTAPPTPATSSSGTGGVSREPSSSRLLQQPLSPAAAPFRPPHRAANLPHRPHLTVRRRVPAAGGRAEGRWTPPRWEAGSTMIMGGGGGGTSSSYSRSLQQQQSGTEVLSGIGGIWGGITAPERLHVDNVEVAAVGGMGGGYARPGGGTGHRPHGDGEAAVVGMGGYARPGGGTGHWLHGDGEAAVVGMGGYARPGGGTGHWLHGDGEAPVVGMEGYARPGGGTGHRLHGDGEAAATGRHRNGRGVVERMPPPPSRAQVRGSGSRGEGRRASGHHTPHLSGDRSRSSALFVETNDDNNGGSYSVVRSAKFIAREHWLAIGDDDGWVHIYAYTTTTTGVSMDKVKEFEAHRGSTVDSLAVHPTDRFLLTSSCIDSSIKLWDWAQDWKRIRTFNVPYEQVDSLTWNPRDTNTFVSVSKYDISLLAATQNSYISQFWEISNSEPITTLEGMKCAGYLCSDDDQRHTIMVTTTKNKEPLSSSQHLQIWDMQREKIVHMLGVCGWKIQDLACHPTLPIFATIHSSGWILCLWDSRSYRIEKMVRLKQKHIRGTISIMDTNDTIRIVSMCGAYADMIMIMDINLPTTTDLTVGEN